VRALRQHRLSQRQRHLELGAGNLGPAGYVFDDRDGSPWDPSAFSLAFYRLIRQSGLPHIRFHDLRHSYGSLGLASGTDLKTISASLAIRRS
jgi:integrase